jgi:hypothetical protein
MDGYAFAFDDPTPAGDAEGGRRQRRRRRATAPSAAAAGGAHLRRTAAGGTDSVVIGEDVTAGDGVVTLREGVARGRHVRAMRLDFRRRWPLGAACLDARRLAPPPP